MNYVICTIHVDNNTILERDFHCLGRCLKKNDLQLSNPFSRVIYFFFRFISFDGIDICRLSLIDYVVYHTAEKKNVKYKSPAKNNNKNKKFNFWWGWCVTKFRLFFKKLSIGYYNDNVNLGHANLPVKHQREKRRIPGKDLTLNRNREPVTSTTTRWLLTISEELAFRL
jgi:hypothetical protein